MTCTNRGIVRVKIVSTSQKTAVLIEECFSWYIHAVDFCYGMLTGAQRIT